MSKPKPLEQLQKERAWREANREKLRAQRAAFTERNPNYAKEYYAKHKDRINAFVKEYRKKNREKVNAWARASQKKDRKKRNARFRQWKASNPEAYRKLAREYHRRRRARDLNYRIRCNLRKRIYSVVAQGFKSASTVALLGCSIESFRTYIESKFQQGMNWENYGTYWHIDHIMPCAIFDLTKPEHQKRCFHFSNLQPLEAIENKIKSAKIITNQFALLLILVTGILLSGCAIRQQAITPNPIVSTQASFSGNVQNSGDVAYGPNGAEKDQRWMERYRALLKLYGARLIPPVKENDMTGIVALPNGYLVTAEISVRFTKLNQMAKNDSTP